MAENSVFRVVLQIVYPSEIQNSSNVRKTRKLLDHQG